MIKNEVPGLRLSDDISKIREQTGTIHFEGIKCCETCKRFSSTALAYPLGWCCLVPSDVVNVSFDKICDNFDPKLRYFEKS